MASFIMVIRPGWGGKGFASMIIALSHDVVECAPPWEHIMLCPVMGDGSCMGTHPFSAWPGGDVESCVSFLYFVGLLSSLSPPRNCPKV